MDDAEFDLLISRASDPRLIVGIYNYCDGRCPRCPFTDRCLNFRTRAEEAARMGADASDSPLPLIARSFERVIEMLRIGARRHGIDLDAMPERPEDNDEAAGRAVRETDPLMLASTRYALTTWPILRALGPILDVRGDEPSIEAADTLGWMCGLIGPKMYRAIMGTLDDEYDPDEVQSDPNGSAKAVRIAIGNSRRAWRVLMEAGRATANGVPAALIRMLDELDAQVRDRFPHAMEFVRPGFDEESPGAMSAVRRGAES